MAEAQKEQLTRICGLLRQHAKLLQATSDCNAKYQEPCSSRAYSASEQEEICLPGLEARSKDPKGGQLQREQQRETARERERERPRAIENRTNVKVDKKNKKTAERLLS